MTAFSTGTSIDFPLARDARLPHSHGSQASGTAEPTEEQLRIDRARRGDTEAFRQLVEAHQHTVLRFCRLWLEGEEDARDACQDVFAKVFRALPRYREEGRFTTWLYRIALNRCRDLRKTRAARLARLSDSFHALDADPPCHLARPDAAAMRSDDAEKLRRGLARLPRRYREVLVLAHLEELPHAECARILGCSERAVEGRLYRARLALRDWWERLGWHRQPEGPPHLRALGRNGILRQRRARLP